MQLNAAVSYSLLGKLLVRNEPEVAYRLMAAIAAPEPLDTDLTKLKDYFLTFCLIQGINSKEYTGALYKSSKIDQRRLFVACMIQIYTPGARSLNRKLSQIFKADETNTRKMRDQVDMWYRTSDQFREKVDETVNKLMGREDE
jgi:hypothetical protein